jgi:N6-L-threonylcarbamoyladenine synthase
MCESIGVEMHMPEKRYCTDNAAMIGAAAYVLYKNKKFAPLSTNAQSSVRLQ